MALAARAATLGRVAALAVPALLACAPAEAQALRPWTGGPPPALELEDVGGALHRLPEYRGKVVLVNFWATWCAPCRKEMPGMEAMRRALEDKPFVILAVNVGENPRTARDFGQQLGLGFPLLVDRDARVAKAWGARALPASYVVGANGRIRYSFFGEIDWEGAEARAQLERLLPREAFNRASR